jgi:chromosome segregation protein
MEVFDKVSEEFSAIFPRLSVNGEGVLYLENGEDPLSGGLNIKASPAGKKITGLELLSGGEKVVTALAFIFALQRYKPAHFYVLDEVDAALDQNNSMRFINLLTDIMKDSQVLLVSHNNAVIKKADRLFGVSMTDGGTSQLVGMDMSELDEKGGQIN